MGDYNNEFIVKPPRVPHAAHDRTKALVKTELAAHIINASKVSQYEFLDMRQTARRLGIKKNTPDYEALEGEWESIAKDYDARSNQHVAGTYQMLHTGPKRLFVMRVDEDSMDGKPAGSSYKIASKNLGLIANKIGLTYIPMVHTSSNERGR